MGLFDSFFQVPDTQAAAGDQTAGYNAGYQDLSKQFGNARTSFMQGVQPFMTNYAAAQPGVNAYGDATGANGSAGFDRAKASFQSAPGFEHALDIASQNILRNPTSAGGNSGAAVQGLSDTGANLAYQQWNNYIQNLAPFLGYSSNSAQGVQQGYGQVGNNYAQQGQAAYGTQAAIGNANANADLATGPGWGIIGGIANAAAKGWGASVGSSDRRIKEDIDEIGETYDGQPLYRYRYKGSSEPRIGLMAQDVERRDPDAVVEIGGIKHVDYGRATNYSAHLGRFLKAA